MVNLFEHYHSNLPRKQASAKMDFEIQMNSVESNIRFYSFSTKELARPEISIMGAFLLYYNLHQASQEV